MKDNNITHEEFKSVADDFFQKYDYVKQNMDGSTEDIIKVVNTICNEVHSQKDSKSSFSVGFAGDYEKDSV
tara:strand:- start:1426 stop:1638 length:213 start_codon:yes stop_codon:yes gene_type:complete